MNNVSAESGNMIRLKQLACGKMARRSCGAIMMICSGCKAVDLSNGTLYSTEGIFGDQFVIQIAKLEIEDADFKRANP
jgi:hypothetical protein